MRGQRPDVLNSWDDFSFSLVLPLLLMVCHFPTSLFLWNLFLLKIKRVHCITYNHGLLIEYGPICHIVKLRISMIRPFSLVNISHITLYPQLEIIWKVSKSLRRYWGKYGQISFYIISCITRDCIIVENIFLV